MFGAYCTTNAFQIRYWRRRLTNWYTHISHTELHCGGLVKIKIKKFLRACRLQQKRVQILEKLKSESNMNSFTFRTLQTLKTILLFRYELIFDRILYLQKELCVCQHLIKITYIFWSFRYSLHLMTMPYHTKI